MNEGAAGNGSVREVLREVLEELLPRVVAGALEQSTGTHEPLGPREDSAPVAAPSRDAPIPQVPAPPVAAVHRPSTWSSTEPSSAAEPGAPAEPATGNRDHATLEGVAIETDADLDAFARRLLRLYENPRDRQALRSGRLRFALRRTNAQGTGATARRIESGAVTERVVNEAAAAHARLVLGPRAVLTPMARDRAKQLRIEIEREKRC